MNANALDFKTEANRLITDLVEKREEWLTSELNSEYDYDYLFYELHDSLTALEIFLDDKLCWDFENETE